MNKIKFFLQQHIRAMHVVCALLAAISISGCQSGSAPKPAQAPASERLTGVVVKVDKAKGLLTVKHDAIPGKMKAMTMPFSPANPAVLSKLHPGDKISADFSVQANGAVLDNIQVLKK
jgi:protein SCO1/2